MPHLPIKCSPQFLRTMRVRRLYLKPLQSTLSTFTKLYADSPNSNQSKTEKCQFQYFHCWLLCWMTIWKKMKNDSNILFILPFSNPKLVQIKTLLQQCLKFKTLHYVTLHTVNRCILLVLSYTVELGIIVLSLIVKMMYALLYVRQ